MARDTSNLIELKHDMSEVEITNVLSVLSDIQRPKTITLDGLNEASAKFVFEAVERLLVECGRVTFEPVNMMLDAVFALRSKIVTRLSTAEEIRQICIADP